MNLSVRELKICNWYETLLPTIVFNGKYFKWFNPPEKNTFPGEKSCSSSYPDRDDDDEYVTAFTTNIFQAFYKTFYNLTIFSNDIYNPHTFLIYWKEVVNGIFKNKYHITRVCARHDLHPNEKYYHGSIKWTVNWNENSVLPYFLNKRLA